MKIKFIIIFTLGVYFTPSVLLAQEENKNRISLQTGLFHYFFDDAPILNVNHRKHGEKYRSGVFNKLLINSVGIKYDRLIDEKSSVSFEFMTFLETYWKHHDTYPVNEALALERRFATFNVNYNRIKNISKKFDFVYGGGLNYRHGKEHIMTARHPIAWWMGEWVYELYVDGSLKNDFGLNAFAGIDYTPWKWLTLYTKIDFMTLVYINDKGAIKRFHEYYTNVPDHFPSRYDLSFRLGIGFNF